MKEENGFKDSTKGFNEVTEFLYESKFLESGLEIRVVEALLSCWSRCLALIDHLPNEIFESLIFKME